MTLLDNIIELRNNYEDDKDFIYDEHPNDDYHKGKIDLYIDVIQDLDSLIDVFEE